MTDETMPDWVLIEAGKQCGWANAPESLRDIYRWTNLAFRALCDNILKHEQPPVDRKVLCAEQAMHDLGWDKLWLGKYACIRAIELWDEGFGK